MLEGGSSLRERLIFAIRTCLIRTPRAGEIERLEELYADVLEHYQTRPEEAKSMATEAPGPLPSGLDAIELASWATVANVLMNLDEFLSKG